MVGWHHRLSGHELEQTLGAGDGQRHLVCCSLLGHKELDMTWRLNNSNPALWVSGYLVLLFAEWPNTHTLISFKA